MTSKNISKGPWSHRFATVFFGILLSILFFWLLCFVVDDIGNLKGPQLQEVEKRHLDPVLVRRMDDLEKQIADINRKINDQKSRQALLRDSTSNSRQTMDQLLEMQRLSIQKNVKPTEAEQNALAESEALFLANQKRYQGLNEDIVRLSEAERGLQERKREIETNLAGQREEARHEFDSLLQKHHLKVACLQLLFLIPLLLISVYFFLKKRSSIYAPLIYASGLATLVKVALVIHEHFPTHYFKYILLLVSIAVVVRILIFLIRSIAFPKLEWLIKQYREAYERFFCPVCEYPIRKGPMKYRFWDRRSIRKLVPVEQPATAKDEPYTCPACGTMLYEECSSCHAVRHSLLPFCEQCGVEKDITATASVIGTTGEKT